MRKVALFILLVTLCSLVAVCSCARRGMPPGGPVDLEPPRIVSMKPDSGEVNTRAVSEICMTFSEPMDKRTVRDAAVIRPGVRVAEAHWQKNTFCLLLTDSLTAARTYTVLLMSGGKDAHGNSIKAPYLWTFSTGDTLFGGSIRGKVLAKGLPAPGIPVWAFDSVRCPAPDFAIDEPDYVSQSGSDGTFELIGLPAGVYLLFGFKDKNTNRAYDVDVDFVSPAQFNAVITPEEPEFTGVEIRMLDPNEPGSIQGIVEHCFPESVSVVVHAVSTEDSLRVFIATAKPDGTFTIAKVNAGQYRVDCFADLNANRTYDPGVEPTCEEIHTVQVMPDEATKDVKLKMFCATPAEPEEKSADEKETVQ
ncbi:MAG: Ig-like domain-containing protein [Candidatus Eisenbacteria bacterium]|nr:Ig-like domain-containing protein [Candidatus Eisenbacteria bacterium]